MRTSSLDITELANGSKDLERIKAVSFSVWSIQGFTAMISVFG